MRNAILLVACIGVAACSHIPLISKPAVTGNVVGTVEYDTGLTRFSTVTGIYHQDMCSKASGDVPVHLSDREMKKILAQADQIGFYKTTPDLTTAWPDPTLRPAHCASFRLRIAAGDKHNEVHWDCGADGSSTPPPQVAPLVSTIQHALRARKPVRELPWSSCQG